jgi:hypothetical protein
LEEQEGMANLNIDQLLLNILMWEAGQKIFLLLGLLLILLEVIYSQLFIRIHFQFSR